MPIINANTAEIATAYKGSSTGDLIKLSAGECNSSDNLDDTALLSFRNKDTTIECVTDRDCIFDASGLNQRVAWIYTDSGSTNTYTLKSLLLREAAFEGNGGALYITNSNVNLIACSLVNNKAYEGGGMFVDSGSVSTSGLSFTGNTADHKGGDIATQFEDAFVTVSGCPSGYDGFGGEALDVFDDKGDTSGELFSFVCTPAEPSDPTSAPTLPPNDDPTLAPSPSPAGSKSTRIIFEGVAGGIFAVLIIGLATVCCRKKPRRTTSLKTNHNAATELLLDEKA